MFSRLFVVLNAISIMLIYIAQLGRRSYTKRLAGTDFHVGFIGKYNKED